MEQEEIIEGNELIAGFMGIFVTRFINQNKKPIGLIQCDDELGNFEWSDFGLDWYNPNSNWNQLMPVVQQILKESDSLNVYRLYVSDALTSANINTVFNSVVTYIETQPPTP